MRDEIFEGGAELDGDGPRGGSCEDAQDGRFERVAVGLRDRGLFGTYHGYVDDVRGVDTVFEVDRTRLTGGAGWWVSGAGAQRSAGTHRSTLSDAMICRMAVSMPSCAPI
jgi:hypothetical protein